MHDIESMGQRLEAADGLADVLAASWDAFHLIAAACYACERGSRELFAAYAFAATAAAEGRTVITAAPSLPTGHGTVTSSVEFVPAEEEAAADALAGLAQIVHYRLSSASRQASDAADQATCTDGAIQAALVRQLLVRDA